MAWVYVVCATCLSCDVCRCWALRRSMAMVKVKRVHADRSGSVKDGRGGLDEGAGVDRGWITLANVDKQVYTRRWRRRCWPSQDSDLPRQAEERGLGDQVIEDKWWHASRSCRKHSGYGILVGFHGFILKTACGRFARFGPQNSRRTLGRYVASSESLHWDESFSWMARSRQNQVTLLGPFCC